MTCKINVIDAIGETLCVAAKEGEKLHDAICLALDANDQIEVSFEGTEIIITAFLHVAVGRLLRQFSKAEVWRRICFTHVEPSAERDIQLVIDHAEKHYQK